MSCETAVAAMGSAMAWPLLPEAMAISSLVGASANAGISYTINGEINPNDVILAYWTGALTANTAFWGTVAVNTGNGAASSYLKGDDPWKGGAISDAASGLGYGIGKVAQGSLDKVLNPNWKNWEWTKLDMGISMPTPQSPLPGIAGNAMSSATTEMLNDQAGKAMANKIGGEE